MKSIVEDDGKQVLDSYYIAHIGALNEEVQRMKEGYIQIQKSFDEKRSKYDKEKLKHDTERRAFIIYKMYWTIRDILLLYLGHDLQVIDERCLIDFPEMIGDVAYYEVLKGEIKDLVISMITDAIRAKDFQISYDVIIPDNSREFKDSPEYSVRVSSFIFLIDKMNDVMDGNFPIQISKAIREIHKRYKIAEKSDGELLLSYLKEQYIDDISAGKSEDELLNKFMEKGELIKKCKLNSKGTQQYYRYLIKEREITKFKSQLRNIAAILLG